MKRVLILIHFASKLNRQTMAPTGARLAPLVMAQLQDSAGVFTSDIALGVTGITHQPSDALLRSLVASLGLTTGDNISVLELGPVIISTHPGLTSWANRTQMVSVRAESGAP